MIWQSQDERRPTCLRCEKGQFKCEEYGGTVFIDAREQVLKHFESKSRASLRSSTSAITCAKTVSTATDEARQKSSTVRYWQVSHHDQHLGWIPSSPSSSPFRDEMYVLYAIDNLCEGPLFTIFSAFLPFDVISIQSQRRLTNHCLLALAKVYYGVQMREHRVLQDGMQLYGQGLRMLIDVLDTHDYSVTTEMIVAVVSLCMGEVCTACQNSCCIPNHSLCRVSYLCPDHRGSPKSLVWSVYLPYTAP